MWQRGDFFYTLLDKKVLFLTTIKNEVDFASFVMGAYPRYFIEGFARNLNAKKERYEAFEISKIGSTVKSKK